MGSGPVRVVCLGGGWVAVYLARSLKRSIRKGTVELTVVSRENYHTFHGFIAEMLVGKIQPHQLISPARRVFRPGRFLNAEIEAVDLESRTVTTSRLLDGRQTVLEFDHLVVALGSRDDPSRYPGLAEHALRLGSSLDAFAARNHIIGMMEMAELETDPEERRRLLTFVVAGGGYGGVEVATELDDYCRLLTRREYPGIAADEIRVVLVHSGDTILPELAAHHASLHRWANQYVASTGLERRPRTRIAAATPEEAVLDDGTRIGTRTIISATGTDMPTLVSRLPLPKDQRGRLIADRYGMVSPNVWAGGDCAAIPHPKGGTNPPLAIYAMRSGALIGSNIERTISGRDPRPFKFTGLGDACSLGRRRAVAHVRGIPVTGLPAWILWRLFLLGFIPTWDRRFRLVLDWALTPLVGREVTQMRLGDPIGITRQLYEPGQVIVRQGDVGRRMCLVYEGEVEVTRSEPDGTEVQLAVLGPGSHFGETAVFQDVRRTATVRALTRVQLVSLTRRDALALSESAEWFGDAVRRSPGVPATQTPHDPA